MSIRGLLRREPLFMKPPCGIRGDRTRDGRPARSAGEMLRAGWEPAELKAQGFTARELATSAKLNADELRSIGFSTKDVAEVSTLRACKFPMSECRAASCSVLELIGAGADPASLAAAGYGEVDFRLAGFGEGVIRALGIPTRGGGGSEWHQRPATSRSRARPASAAERRPRSARARVAEPVAHEPASADHGVVDLSSSRGGGHFVCLRANSPPS